ncbi:MAG: hypothetical protein Roseis2KO_46320 [Roseivirga sp.]
MLSGLFLFSLKSSVVLCVLYLAYHFLFKRNTHFHIKRSILLLIMAAAIFLPLLEYETSSELAPESPAIHQLDKLKASESTAESLSEAQEKAVDLTSEVSNPAPSKLAGSGTDWLEIAGKIYISGVIFMLTLFLIEVMRLSWILGKGKARHDLNRMAVTHPLIKFPFSFWRWIFLPTDLTYDEKTWELIQEHENVHLNQGHTLDILFSTILRCLLWFNPAVYFLQKNIKDNHEALADRTVLEEHDLSQYSKALLEVCLQTGSLNLGHAFALKSNLSKRINTMNLSDTTLGKSILSLLLFCAISLGVFTQTSLYGQGMKQEDKEKIQKALDSGLIDFTFMAYSKLPERHQRVLEKLRKLNPGVELRWQYQEDNTILEYLEEYRPNQETLYFDKITKEDKKGILQQALSDTLSRFFQINDIKIEKQDFSNRLEKSINERYNYLLIYELKADPYAEENRKVYEMDEVDILPEPIGGINSFVRAIALDAELPEGISTDDLPPTIDFEFVIKGGRGVTSMNLVTELKGNRKKQDKIYKFFGELHNNIRNKARSVYSWRKGMKEGKEVNVRMIVSIPTKYM